MGKIFPQVINLKERPEFFQATLALIEQTFSYHAPNTFEIDFFPLINETNHHNCFILINESEEVVAHIGARDSFFEINGEKFPFTMLGGISVDERYRGQGHFQTLMNDVLAEKKSDTALFVLWSDLEKLYSKFGFHLCGNQFEVPHVPHVHSYKRTKLGILNIEQKTKIKFLYDNSFAKTYTAPLRTDSNWYDLSQISSADLYIKEKYDIITDYFFMNKGQDLPGVVYEYGSEADIVALISEASGYGKVWMGAEFVVTDALQYHCLMAPGDTKLFSQLIYEYTNFKIAVRDVNQMKQEVFFDFADETLVIELPEFLRGIFGPGQFAELGANNPLFISGLDSI